MISIYHFKTINTIVNAVLVSRLGSMFYNFNIHETETICILEDFQDNVSEIFPQRIALTTSLAKKSILCAHFKYM